MAFNFWSSLSLYSTLCKILDWNFRLNYSVLTVCKITQGKDEQWSFLEGNPEAVKAEDATLLNSTRGVEEAFGHLELM